MTKSEYITELRNSLSTMLKSLDNPEDVTFTPAVVIEDAKELLEVNPVTLAD